MFLSIGMLKQNYFLADIFILSAEKQPIKLSWRKIEWLQRKKSYFRFCSLTISDRFTSCTRYGGLDLLFACYGKMGD